MNKPSRQDVAGAAYFDLQKLARSTGRPTDELLQLYALEGFLDRLSVSAHREHLVLKGGVLLAAFDVRRPTRDIDFAATSALGDPGVLNAMIGDVIAVPKADGLVFDQDAIDVDPIRTTDPYPGLRARVAGGLSRAKIRFHIDVNIGDPILPPPSPIEIPRLLGGDPISLVGYVRELVLAEKIVTAISRGTANTRWRDFVDIAALAQQPIDTAVLRASIGRVAAFRQVTVVPLGDVLEGFAEIAQPRWAGWRTKQRLVDEPEDFRDLLATVIDLVDSTLVG